MRMENLKDKLYGRVHRNVYTQIVHQYDNPFRIKVRRRVCLEIEPIVNAQVIFNIMDDEMLDN